MGNTPRVALLEPWFGESHATLFNGVAEHAGLQCTLITLPARRWRWRMRLGAVHLAEALNQMSPRPDVLIVSDYVNLLALKGLCPTLAHLPSVVYFLENQLTYPVRPGQRLDFEFQGINLLTCLGADCCVFCSRDQLDAFLDALPGFLAHDQDSNAKEIVEAIQKKSLVIPIGVDLARFDRARQSRPDRAGTPLRIVWPHRFEHDKNPDDFFDTLCALAAKDRDFEVSVMGKSYRDLPKVMAQARHLLGNRVVNWGFLEGDAYANALSAADLVVSTAWQETQGIAVIEAIRAGCDPLLPNRLSYPEVLGPALSEKHLYQSTGDLRRRLDWMMRHPDRIRATADHWPEMERFGWTAVGPQFKQLVEDLLGSFSSST